MASERLTDEELASLEQWSACDLREGEGRRVDLLVTELRERREKDMVHSQSHCLDCEGPLVQCDCQPNCPGGMCARACHLRASSQRLTGEEREALAWLRELVDDDYRRFNYEPKYRAAINALSRLLAPTEGK